MSNRDPNQPALNPLAVELPLPAGDIAAVERAGAESPLDDITHLACALCQAPVALICSRDQQGWRLSHNFGEEHEPLSFDLAFYTFAVTQRRGFEIADLRSDPAFAGSPLVTGAPHFRFFAGIPIASEDNQLMGAICILDTRTRSLTIAQRKGLEALARQVRAHLRSQQNAAVQRQNQAVANEQQRQWRRVFETASIGMAEISVEGQWTQINSAFCATLGYTVNELMETRLRDLIHPDDVNSSLALLRKTLAGEIPSCSGEKRLLHRTGKAVWCSIHVTLVRDAEALPAYFVAHIIDISELRQAQDGWRNTELQLRTFLDLPTPVAILTTDLQGGITFANRYAEQLTGYVADELSGKRSIASLFLDLELREHSQEIAHLFGSITKGAQTILEHARNAGPETREWTWLRKDGGAIRVSVTVTAIRNSQNAISGFAIAAMNAVKADEGAPGTSEGRFRTIADSAPLGMFLTDAHGNCTYVNEAFQQITSVGHAEAVGQGWYGAIAQDDRGPFYNEFQKAMRRGSDFLMEVRLARPNAPAWIRVRGREIFFEDVAQGYVGSVEDITGLRTTFEALKASEEKLRNLITSAPFALALLDRERKCVTASVGWLDLHRRTWNEVNGRNIFEFMPEIRDRLEDLCRRALNGGATLSHEQSVRLQEDAPAEFLRWHIFPWRVAGEISGVGIFEERLTPMMRSIADTEAARDAAEAASRVKSDFLAEVSSELRTPAAGIVGLVDLLLERETNPQRREYLEMIKTSIGSWLKLAGDIYDFSKMEARKLELEILPFNLIDGLAQTMRRLAATAENKGLELVLETGVDVPSVVVGDGVRLFQVLGHLTGFAIDMTPQGEVRVSVELGESVDRNPSLPGALEFHFTVRDNSGWLSDNKLADIQQVLVMVENSPALKKVGTSLGLVLSARMISLMNGRLWVERGENGANFHFTVPLSGKRQTPTPIPALTDVSILIADDNLSHRRWLQTLLTSWGARPTVLEKPGAILDVVEIAQEAGRPFRFVLLDAHIPDRDTFAFASQLVGDPKTSHVVPIMLLSSGMRVADESRARDLNLRHSIVKPINPNELRELLERLLGGQPAAPEAPPERVKRSVLLKPRLNILIVDDSRFNHEVAMGVFGPEGHRVTAARNGREALAILERRVCDIVLFDTGADSALEMLASIRQREKENQRRVFVFGLTPSPATAERDPGLKDIADGFLPNPIQPKYLTLLLEEIGPELEFG